jgi:hypothetical protein
MQALNEQAAYTRNPELNPRDLVARLAGAGVPGFADEIGRRL